MDFIPDNPLLKFHENTLSTIRKHYNLEKKEDMNSVIDLLDDWLKNQRHLLKRSYSRDYLERIIIFQKGSIERAKAQIDKICTLRTLLPDFFGDYEPQRDCFSVIQYSYVQACLPTLTSDNYRIYFAKMVNDKLNSKLIFTIFTLIIIFFEYLKLSDYCDGYILMIDIRDINILDLVKAINIVELHQMATITLEGFAFRIKGIHLVTPSPAVDLLVKIMKQVSSKKIGERIQVHKDIESLHNVVNKRLLPKEYGGDEDPLISLYDTWAKIISTQTHKDYMKEINKARTDESLRDKNNLIKNEYFGITGTFRNLSVD